MKTLSPLSITNHMFVRSSLKTCSRVRCSMTYDPYPYIVVPFSNCLL